jgi:hypothetical protein
VIDTVVDLDEDKDEYDDATNFFRDCSLLFDIRIGTEFFVFVAHNMTRHHSDCLYLVRRMAVRRNDGGQTRLSIDSELLRTKTSSLRWHEQNL